MSKVIVISDTHGTLTGLAYIAIAEADYIIHAGDIGNPAIIRELETLAPVYAVLGNNDYPEYGDSISKFARPVIDGVRFLVSHYPRDVKVGGFGNASVAPGEPIPHICIHGHTHTPKLLPGSKETPKSPVEYIVCPGSVSRPRNGVATFAEIEVEHGRIVHIQIKTLDGKVIDSI